MVSTHRKSRRFAKNHFLEGSSMLVLSRKKNESIVINADITVTVVEIRGDKVRLGIVAPKEVPIHRQEVFEAIHSKPGAEPAPSTVVAKPIE